MKSVCSSLKTLQNIFFILSVYKMFLLQPLLDLCPSLAEGERGSQLAGRRR